MNDALAMEDLATLDALVPELIEPVPPPPALRAQILAAVSGLPQNSITVRAGEERWRPFPATGVRWKKLSSNRANGTLTLLMEIAPGAAAPAHGHHGAEDCFVVAGSCRIGTMRLAQGDFHHVESGAQHGTVESDEGCTLLLVVDARDWAA